VAHRASSADVRAVEDEVAVGRERTRLAEAQVLRLAYFSVGRLKVD